MTPLNLESIALVGVLSLAALASSGALGFTNFQTANAQTSCDKIAISAATLAAIPADEILDKIQNVTSSVKVRPPILDALPRINFTMSDAIAAAESAVGNNSKAISATLLEVNNSLIYSVLVVNPTDTVTPFYTIVLDPGDGQFAGPKFTCKCTDCKPLPGGKDWVCTGCTCTPEVQPQ